MNRMIENLLNRGYVYDSYRESYNAYYDRLEADVDFWYGNYCRAVDEGTNDPDIGIDEYIAGKIDEEHPTSSPEEFNDLIKEVRVVRMKIDKNWSVSIREAGAAIGGTMQYANGQASGRALAGDMADKGIRDVTPGTDGRGQAEVDKTGVYVGVPIGPDKTAWANPQAAKNVMPQAMGRIEKYQQAYANAPKEEKAQMQDWSPEKPDMAMNKNGQVVDTKNGNVMPAAAATQRQPAKGKSSILQKLGFRESKEAFFESLLNMREASATVTAYAAEHQNASLDQAQQAVQNPQK